MVFFPFLFIVETVFYVVITTGGDGFVKATNFCVVDTSGAAIL